MTDVEVRDAATVVLLRDGAAGLEVWLLTRVSQMVFAGGMAVFPGGRVDDADADLPFAAGAEATAVARLGCEPHEARALLGAAVRETFEETGVLLTVPAADLSGARTDVEAGRVSFGDLLRANGLSVDAEAVHLWARWITPPGEVRRYDARFFVAAMPSGVDAQDVTSESSAAGWFGVGDALERAQRGEIGLMPPTIVTLASLAKYGTVAEAIAAAEERILDPVEPTISRDDDGGYRAELPDGTSFALPKSLFNERPVSDYERIRQVTPQAAVLLQNNPGPMTLDGTNTWLLRDPSAAQAIVVDPGQTDETHVAAVRAAAGEVALIVLTHRHFDHGEAAPALHEATGAPVVAMDPALCIGADPITDGAELAAAGVELRVLATPGHTSDSACLVLGSGPVLTGDSILGRGTTVVAHPDGNLGAYLASLERIRDLGDVPVLPGHGPELPSALAVASEYLAHRAERLDQIRAALKILGPDATARAVVEHVYADVPQDVWWAAELSVKAQLEYLRS